MIEVPLVHEPISPSNFFLGPCGSWSLWTFCNRWWGAPEEGRRPGSTYPGQLIIYRLGGARREGNHIERSWGVIYLKSLHGEWFEFFFDQHNGVSEWNFLYLYIFTPLHPIAKNKLSHRVGNDQRFPNDSPAQISGSAGRPELFKWASPCVAAMCCRFFCCWGQVWSKHRDILKWPFALKSQRRGWNSRIHRWKSKQHVVMVTENPGKRYFL